MAVTRAQLLEAAEITRKDLGPTGTNYPYVRTLLAFAEQELKGVDLHKQKAAEMFNIPIEQVTEEQRRAGKSANYHDMYAVRIPPMRNSGESA